MQAEDIVVTKREHFSTVRQQVRPKTREEAIEVLAGVIAAYQSSRMTGPVPLKMNFNQGTLTVIEFDQIARIPDGSEADIMVTALFAKTISEVSA